MQQRYCSMLVHLFPERGLILISAIPATKIDISTGSNSCAYSVVIFNIAKSTPCVVDCSFSRRPVKPDSIQHIARTRPASFRAIIQQTFIDIDTAYIAWPIFGLLPISLENRQFVRRFYNFCRPFRIPINFLTYYRWLQHLSGYTLISCSLNYRVWEKLTRQHRWECGFVVTWLQRGENGGGKKQRCIVKMKKSSRWFVYERRGETRGKNRAAFVASICYSRCTVFRSVRPLILIHKHGQSYTVGRWSVTGRSHRLIYVPFVAIMIPVSIEDFPFSKRLEEFRESGTVVGTTTRDWFQRNRMIPTCT